MVIVSCEGRNVDKCRRCAKMQRCAKMKMRHAAIFCTEFDISLQRCRCTTPQLFCAELQKRRKRASPSLQRHRCTTPQLFCAELHKRRGKLFPHLCKGVDAPRLNFFLRLIAKKMCKDVDASRCNFAPNCKKRKGEELCPPLQRRRSTTTQLFFVPNC